MAKERKGKKLRRCTKLKSYYSAQYGRTESNKLRKMRRHLKRNPSDAQNLERYVELGGKRNF